MTPANHIGKAERALASARLLLNEGDADGACNRAYYAMFDATHAALLAAQADIAKASVKTHRGLIAAFGKHLVLGGHVDAKYGGALNKVERLRQLADYTGDPISTADAAWAVDQAASFVDAMRTKFIVEPSSE